MEEKDKKQQHQSSLGGETMGESAHGRGWRNSERNRKNADQSEGLVERMSQRDLRLKGHGMLTG